MIFHLLSEDSLVPVHELITPLMRMGQSSWTTDTSTTPKTICQRTVPRDSGFGAAVRES